MKKKSSHPYWTGIIIGALIPSITDIAGWTSIWSFLWNKVILFTFNDILLFKLLMPVWILLLIVLLFIFLIYKTWRHPIFETISILSGGANLNNFIRSYVTDKFDGLQYHWSWIEGFGEKLEIDSISILCPKCDCPLVGDGFEMRCPHCKHRVPSRETLNKKDIQALIQYKLVETIKKSS